MKTIYEYVRERDFQKKYTSKQKKSLLEYYKTSDPVAYFVDQIRYRDLLTMSFKDKSEYWKTFDIIKNKLSVYFFSFKVEKKKNQYNIVLSFSDFIRFLLINDLRISFWIDDLVLRNILLFLRYDVTKSTNKTPPEDLIPYIIDPELFFPLYEQEYGKAALKEKITKINQEVKSLWISIVMHHLENNKFEKILYYMFHYNNPMYLLLGFEGKTMYRVDYIRDTLEGQCYRKWIYFDLLYFMFPYAKKYKDSLWDVFRTQILDSMDVIKNKIKLKHNHISNLRANRNMISLDEIKEDDTYYKLMSERITKAQLESDIGIYDIYKEQVVLPDDLGDVFKDMQEFISKVWNSELTVSFKDQKPMYMKGKFKTDDMNKFQDLQEYTSDYWYVARKSHKWTKKTIVGEKEFKYKKPWNGDQKQ